MFSLLLAASAATECSNTDLRRSASRWSIAEGCTSLNLSKSKLGAAEMALLAKALADHPQLTTLKLERNSLGAAGAKSLAEALRTSRLAAVHLAFNSLGDEGAAALAAALPEAKALASLSIDRNEVGPRGAKALADALPRSAALRELDLVELGGQRRRARARRGAAQLGAHLARARLELGVGLGAGGGRQHAEQAAGAPRVGARARAVGGGVRAARLAPAAARRRALGPREGRARPPRRHARHVPLELGGARPRQLRRAREAPDARLVERELLAALYAEHERQKA